MTFVVVVFSEDLVLDGGDHATEDNFEQTHIMSMKASARQKRHSYVDRCRGNPKYCPYRTADGSYNNLDNPTWGKSDEPQRRCLNNAYADGISMPRTLGCNGTPLKSVREISNIVHNTASSTINDVKLSVFSMVFGQLMAHDFVRTPVIAGLDCCGADKANREKCFSIDIPENDKVFKDCMALSRSQWRPDRNGVRQQLNKQTSYLDGSHFYGANQEEQDELRGDKKCGKLIKVTVGQNKVKLPKYTRDDLPCTLVGPMTTENYCTLAGDRRSDENPQLAALHTLFLREHNRIAGILKGYNKYWDDETLFQETRKIVIAELQHITYNEYVSCLVGQKAMENNNINVKKRGFKNTYRRNVDATTSNSFNVATFRMGHSQIQAFVGQLLRDYTDAKPKEDLDLHFFRVPLYHNFNGHGIDHLVRWSTNKQSPKIDVEMEASVRDKLFKGRDLSALNMQRSREHGVPGYNAFRALCNLPVATHFGVTGGGLVDMNAETAALLEKAYTCPDDIDLFPGMLSERHADGASVGPLLQCLLVKQFAALRLGDRFFYEENNKITGFSEKQLNAIKKVTMASVICANSDTTEIQENVFIQENAFPNNGRRNCRSIPQLDTRPWKYRGKGKKKQKKGHYRG